MHHFFLFHSPQQKQPLALEKKRRGCHAHNISDRKAARRSITSPPRILLSCEIIIHSTSCVIRFPVYVVRSKMILVLFSCQVSFVLFFYYYPPNTHNGKLLIRFIFTLKARVLASPFGMKYLPTNG